MKRLEPGKDEPRIVSVHELYGAPASLPPLQRGKHLTDDPVESPPATTSGWPSRWYIFWFGVIAGMLTVAGMMALLSQ